MPLTVGTAGHVDHGKTWLVRALTGKDTDRLPEEQRRGISIELGYAPLELPGGLRLSLIDVPGHERFVRTMVAGATGIDLFLLVVDAREGARAQTHEHLAILRLLGVDSGVVAVTKADAADPEPERCARRHASSCPARRRWPSAPRPAPGWTSCAPRSPARRRVAQPAIADGPTRLFVDRVFTLRGIGTVATGTLWSGSVGAGDELRAEPAGLDAAGAKRAGARPAGRAGRGRPARGGRAHRRRPRPPGPRPRAGRAGRLRGRLPPRRRARGAGAAAGARVRAHHGTTETAARVVRAARPPSQLRLSEPVVAARGDRIVLRAGTTVAGAVVLDPAPSRRDPAEVPVARPQPAGEPTPVDTAEVEGELAAAGGEPFRVADGRAAAALEREGRLVRVGDGFALERDAYERARELVVAECERPARSRSPASATCWAARAGRRSSCSSGSTATASPSGWVTSAGSGAVRAG